MRQAFLDAIREAPEDDTPRLVFADWLDENGDPDRAEFIRLQCHLAHQPVPDTEMRLRAADLLDANQHAWLEGFPEAKGVRPGGFSRGFLSWVEVDSLDHFRTHGASLLRTPARNVRVRETDGDPWEQTLPSDWPEWDEFADVAGLAFAFWPFWPDQVRFLASSPHLRSLRALTITYSDFDSASMAVLAGSSRFASLHQLDLTNHLVCADGIRALARSEHLTGLRSLNLSHDTGTNDRHNRFSTEAMLALANAPALARLNVLHLCPFALTRGAVAALAASTTIRGLRSLTLMNREPKQGAILPLFGSAVLAGLERLDMRELSLPAKDAMALFASPRPTGLRSLRIRVEGSGAEVGKALAESPWLAGLHELGFVGHQSALVPSLTEADSLTELVELDLGAVSLDDEGLSALARSLHLDNLISLVVGPSIGVTESACRAFAEADGFPRLRRLAVRGGSGESPVVAALAGSPLAARLTSLDLSALLLRGLDALPFFDRDRWPCLKRLIMTRNVFSEETRQELRDIWGPLVHLGRERDED